MSSSYERNLSDILTLKTLVRQAQQNVKGENADAKKQLLEIYGGAAHRYLFGAVRDPDTANELFQEFAVRFLEGGPKGYDATRGRFRGYIKGILFHLIADNFNRQRRKLNQLPEELADPSSADNDRVFASSWRDELLARAWEKLAELESRFGQPYHTVLKMRTADSALTSKQMAERVGEQIHKPLTAEALRQLLHRAREFFAEFVIDDVAGYLTNPGRDELEQELTDLELLDYVAPVLAKRFGSQLEPPATP